MINEKHDNFILLKDEKDNPKDFSGFLGSIHHQFEKDNLIIDLQKFGKLSLDELLSFLELSNEHRRNKKSFVIINDTINIDEVPDELNVVPTFQEAVDMVQMEEIERDLGF
ncbi:MAG: ribonuclease Z [Bacteroidota bacterium]